MEGQGARWGTIEQLFSTQCDRLGLEHQAGEAPEPPPMQPPSRGWQLPLIF